MPSSKCPGSDGRDITCVDVKCPSCGTMVEMFSDEARRRCPVCGTRVERIATMACAAHCPAAASCLGPERYRELIESGMLEQR